VEVAEATPASCQIPGLTALRPPGLVRPDTMHSVSDSLTPVNASPGHEKSATPTPRLRVLVYSDDRLTRQDIVLALGRRPAPELPMIDIIECATEPLVVRTMDTGKVDLAILDGEARPAGGMGVCRQMKDEIFRCAPILVVIGRPQDAWLATWSRADGVVPMPIDPRILADTAASLLRKRLVGIEST
jgi:CheY-like chemotaxis protein